MIVPLLDELDRFSNLHQKLKLLTDEFEFIYVIYVTTEREYLINPISSPNTIELVSQEIREKRNFFHVTYPAINKVVAEQLNYAVDYLNEKEYLSSNDYITFYNADSVIDQSTIVSAYNLINDEKTKTIQQSSLFLANIEKLTKEKKYLLSAFAFYQSIWTIRHEIPQYLYDTWLPNILRKHHLLYAITHGLFIQKSVIQEVGKIPMLDIGGEDLALGFILKSNGYSIFSLPQLENSDSPENLESLYRQLSNWYLATLGYFSFHSIKNEQRSNSFTKALLTLQGLIVHPLKWIMRGPIIVILLALCIKFHIIVLGISLYLLYVYIPCTFLLFLWKRLDKDLFPSVSKTNTLKILLIYPFVPILRSIPAISGLITSCKIVLGHDFIKQKT